MKSRFGLLLTLITAIAPVFACAAPIVYHVDYESNGVIIIGTITTDGKLGVLSSSDIVDLNLDTSITGFPAFPLYPFGYSYVDIKSNPLTATDQGLFYDTTNKGGYFKINSNIGNPTEIAFEGGSMVVGSYYTATVPISGNFELATVATPVPPPAPPVKFQAEADSIYGTISTTAPGVTARTTSLFPVDGTLSARYPYTNSFATTVSGDAPDPGTSRTIFGVLTYNFRNIDNSSQMDYTVAVDDAIAEAKTGEGSLLGGLVYWQSHDGRLVCKPDVNVPKRVGCVATETIKGLLINRVTMHAGKYPAGTAFPVFGPVSDSGCAAGKESFSGYLILQESQITGVGTSAVTVSLTGMHLIGDATCSSALSGAPYTTRYDLAVGGPSAPNYDTGTGNSAPPTTAFYLELQ